MARNAYNWDDLITNLFDLLADSPEGKSLADICDRLEVESHVASLTIARLRETLGDDGDANIICRAAGRQRLYFLVGSGLDQSLGMDEDSAWFEFHRRYVKTRLSTVRNVYMSLNRAAQDERQAEAFRRILKNLDRLIEDIADSSVDA